MHRITHLSLGSCPIHQRILLHMHCLYKFFLILLTAIITADVSVAEKVLLLDATQITHSDNIRIAIGSVRKSANNPMFGGDRPWEPRIDNMYPNIVWDEQASLYQCWYNPFLVEVEDWNGSTPKHRKWLYLRDSGLCYAESTDGIHWTKPLLNILTFRGQPSNIIVRDVHGIGVFFDHHEANPARRYKMIFVKQAHGVRSTMGVAFSNDGIHWGSPIYINNVHVMADTHNNALWAPTLGRYVAFTRDWIPRKWQRDISGNIPAERVVARIESKDFEHWSDSQVILRGTDKNHQIYEMLVFYYGGVYLGMPVIYDIQTGRTHPELAWSKDTVTWHRIEPGVALIPNGPAGSYDWGCIYPAAYPLATANGIKLYYAGSEGTHSASNRGGHLDLALMRIDGFAAAVPDNPARPGEIVTQPHRFNEHGQLLLTMDIEPTGSVVVAALDDSGRVIAHSNPLTGSSTAQLVTWLGATSNPLRGRVRLQFTLIRAKLYSYDIVSGG